MILGEKRSLIELAHVLSFVIQHHRYTLKEFLCVLSNVFTVYEVWVDRVKERLHNKEYSHVVLKNWHELRLHWPVADDREIGHSVWLHHWICHLDYTKMWNISLVWSLRINNTWNKTNKRQSRHSQAQTFQTSQYLRRKRFLVYIFVFIRRIVQKPFKMLDRSQWL